MLSVTQVMDTLLGADMACWAIVPLVTVMVQWALVMAQWLVDSWIELVVA